MTYKLTLKEGNIVIGTMEITDAQISGLAHDLPGAPGFWKWISGAVIGKSNNSTKRLEAESFRQVRVRGITPASLSQNDIIEAWRTDPAYADRASRDQRDAQERS